MRVNGDLHRVRGLAGDLLETVICQCVVVQSIQYCTFSLFNSQRGPQAFLKLRVRIIKDSFRQRYTWKANLSAQLRSLVDVIS